jgi:thiamine-phosphate pyrophosphorylase
VVVLTSPQPVRRELELLPSLLDLGVCRVHVRWPKTSSAETREHLERVPPSLRRHLVLHRHPELAAELGLMGTHWPDGSDAGPAAKAAFRTRSCHTVEALQAAWGHFDRILVAPVFPSISKPGHTPVVHDWRLGELARLDDGLAPGPRRPSRACALGGICAANLRACRDAGFDEVAVLGAVWGSGAPLENVATLCATARALAAPAPPTSPLPSSPPQA